MSAKHLKKFFSTFYSNFQSIYPQNDSEDHHDLVKKEYSEFFKNREREKRKHYFAVTHTGWIISGFGFFLLTISNFLSKPLLNIIGTIIAVNGSLIFTPVPTDVINFEHEILRSIKVRFVFVAVVSFVIIGYGVLNLKGRTYFLSFVVFLLGVSTLGNIYPFRCFRGFSYKNKNIVIVYLSTFTGKLTLFGFLHFVNRSTFYIWAACQPHSICYNTLSCETDGELLNTDVPILSARIIYGLVGSLYILMVLEWSRCARLRLQECQSFCRDGKLKDSLRGINSIGNKVHAKLLDMLYLQVFKTIQLRFLTSMILVIAGYTLNERLDIHGASTLELLIVAIFTGVPFIGIYYLGKDRWFYFLSRNFELNMTRVENDGAWMAEMVSKSSEEAVAVGKTRWIFRKNKSMKYKTQPGYIEREFWMKGKIVSVNEYPCSCCKSTLLRETRIEVNFAVDCRNWAARFEKDRLIEEKGIEEEADEITFEKWIEINFGKFNSSNSDNTYDTNRNIEVNSDKKTVIVKEIDVAKHRERLELLTWAKLNLRKYVATEDVDDFTNLFTVSPRDLYNDQMKEEAFAKSCKQYVSCEANKLNYFMSHSWSDDGVLKAEKIVEFLKTKKRKRAADKNRKKPRDYLKSFATSMDIFDDIENSFAITEKINTKGEISLWFDKVCIDQKSPQDTLAVLPINVELCKKLLVLMSESYLRRLWCVWELFTLFLFCQKEIAVERLEIIPLFKDGITDNDNDNENELKKWKLLRDNLNNNILNGAHCFDPNEELKLRIIMYAIGEDSLEVIHEEIKYVVEKKIKNRFWFH